MAKKYLFREIGESDWWHCNKDFYEYANRSPEFEAKEVEEDEN